MSTPHSKKQRKIPRKVAPLLVGLTAVCFLCFVILSFSIPKPSPFQLAASEEGNALKWVFITPYGETDSSYNTLFPSQEDCASMAGTPVDLSFCTMEKYLNMTAAGIPADVVTCWYTNSNFKRLEATGDNWSLQDLLNKEIPGFTLPEDFVQWCGNFQGQVYAYPHTRTILSEDTSLKSDAAMIGRKDILENIRWDSLEPLSKERFLEQLKNVRKAYPELIPCYVELPSLQQMFGVTADTGAAWEDPFFHPGTLEALEFMNNLFRERLLSHDVFTLSQESLLRQLQNGEIFLAASPSLGRLLSLLPENHPIREQYEVLSPILSDSGREPAFTNNFEEQYASTLFVKGSTQSRPQARLVAAFYLQNMELSSQQKSALESSGFGSILTDAKPVKAIGIDNQDTVPAVHYEILFSLYSNTRLATVAERKQSFLENQVVNLVEDCSAEEVAPAYTRLVSELQSGDYQLLDTWKKQQYQKAISILQGEPVSPDPLAGE